MNSDEPETYFVSKAKDREMITEDLNLVVTKMIQNRKIDRALSAKQLFFDINGTNGYIKVIWYNHSKQKALGKWIYWLEIEKFWKIAGKHKDGMFYFDKECYWALFDYMEKYIYNDTGDALYRIFFKTEGNAIEELYF